MRTRSLRGKLGLLIGCALLGSLGARGEPPLPAGAIAVPGFSLEKCLRTFDPAKVEPTAVGYQYWFADDTLTDGRTVKLSVVGPHLASHPPHRHAEDEFFFVLEGRAEFFLDGERREAGPMTLFYCPSWHEHGIRNLGDTDLKYLVIKKYAGKVPHATTVPVRDPHAAALPAMPVAR